MMSNADQAVQKFQSGCNCAQAVLTCYAERLGMDVETAFRIAAPFGGGMGRMGEVCGALTGAIMVIGLRYSALPTDVNQDKDILYKKVRELIQLFKEQTGAIHCRELTGFDLTTAEGYQNARQAGVFTKRCPVFVRTAANILDTLI